MSDNNKLKPGWKVWRFDQMATNVNVRIDNPSESGMEHYVGLEHLDADSLKIRRWGTPDDVEATKLMFKKGDIIFGRRRAYQRKLGVAEFDGICSAHAMVLRAKPDVVLPEFLPFFMQSDLFMNRAVEISVGSLSPTINWKTMAAQEFCLPPIDDQHRIADAFRAIVDVRESLKGLAESEKDLLLSRLIAIWSKGPIETRRLSEISSHLTSGSRGWAEHYDDKGPALFVRITNMMRGAPRLDLSDKRKVTPPKTLEATRTRVVDGDLLLSITAELGLAAVAPEGLGESYVNQHLALIRIDPTLANSKYVAWYLCSPPGQGQIARFNDPGAKAGMNLKAVAGLQIPWVPLEEQALLAESLNSIDSAFVETLNKEQKAAGLQKCLSEEIFGSGA
jgi:type I restriction enzyme S subunit